MSGYRQRFVAALLCLLIPALSAGEVVPCLKSTQHKWLGQSPSIAYQGDFILVPKYKCRWDEYTVGSVMTWYLYDYGLKDRPLEDDIKGIYGCSLTSGEVFVVNWLGFITVDDKRIEGYPPKWETPETFRKSAFRWKEECWNLRRKRG